MITWRSPRPMSAAGLIRRGGADLFVKRHQSGCARPHSSPWSTRSSAICGPGASRRPRCCAPRTARPPPSTATSSTRCTSWPAGSTVPGRGVLDPVHQPRPRAGGRGGAGPAARRGGPLPAAGPSPAVLTSGCEIIVSNDPLAEVKWLAGRRPGLAATWTAGPGRTISPGTCCPPSGGPRRCWPGCPGSGARGLAPVQPDLDLRGPGRRRGRRVRLRAGQPDLRGARPGHGAGAGHRVLARPGRRGPGRGGPGRDRRVAGRLRVGPPAVPGRGLALPAVFPVVHVEYALSEVEYFAHVVSSPANADLAYDGYSSATPPGSTPPTAPPSSTTSAAAPAPGPQARPAGWASGYGHAGRP